MLAFFCLGARYRPWRYFAALHSRVFGDGAAPRRTRCSPQPRQYSVFRASGGGVLQVLPSAPFFCGEGGSYLVRGESSRSSMARSSRMRSRATGSGNILARYVPKCLAVARSHHGAFPGGNPWQFFRLMHLRGGFGRENRQFAARFARHASENGLALARYARHASEMPRKPPLEDTPREYLARKGHFSLHRPLKSCTARESCHSWVFRLGVAGEVRGEGCRRSACGSRTVPVCAGWRGCFVGSLTCSFELLPAYAQDAPVVAPAFA